MVNNLISQSTYLKLFYCFLFLICYSSDNLKAQKECAIIVQGWEKPKGYVDPKTGKIEKEEETNIVNSTDMAVRAYNQYPKGAKVTAIRPNYKMGTSKVEGYANKAELLKKLEKALCDADCEDIVLIFNGHGDPDSGAFWAANVKAKKDPEAIMPREIAKLIAKCKTHIKLVSGTCGSGQFNEALLEALGKNKDLVEVASSATRPGKCGSATPKGVSWFLQYFIEDYYLIISNPNLMRQLAAEAERLKQEAIKAAEIKKAEAALAEALEEEIKNKEDAGEAAAAKKAAAKAAAEEAERIKKIKEKIETAKKQLKGLVPPSNFYDKYFKMLLDNIKLLPPAEQQKEISLAVDLLLKKIADIDLFEYKLPKNKKDSNYTTFIKSIIELANLLSPKDRLEILMKLKKTVYKLAAFTDGRSPGTDSYKNYRKHVTILSGELSRISKEIKKCKEEIKNEAKKPAIKPAGKPAVVKPGDNKPKPPAKIIPEVTPTTMALVHHYAFKSAHAKVRRVSSKQQPQEQVVPKPDDKNIKFPKKAPVSIWVGKPEYSFNFYKVIDSLTKECTIVGFVRNIKGEVLSRIFSTECNIDCSKTIFYFFDKKGEKHEVDIKSIKGSEPKVTIDKKEQKAKYKYVRLDLKKDGKKLAKLKIVFKMGEDPTIKIHRVIKVKVKGKDNKEVEVDKIERIETKNFKFNEKEGFLEFEMKIDGKWIKVRIDILAHSEFLVTIGNGKPYKDYLAMNFNLFDSENRRVAHASLLQDGQNLNGEVWFADDDKNYAIDGYFLDNGQIWLEFEKDNKVGYVYSNFSEGHSSLEWRYNDEINNVQVLPNHTFVDFNVDPNIITNEEPYSILLDWKNDYSVLNPEIEVLGYEIFKYSNGDENPKIFKINKNSKSFLDEEVTSENNYTYQVSILTKNQSTSDGTQLYEHISLPNIFEVNNKFIEDPERNVIVPIILGGAVIGTTAAILLTNDDDDISGCIDPNSCTYNSEATVDDGSCLYLDCLGVCGGDSQIDAECDDNNPCTINDVYNANCDCEGTILDSDGDGVCDEDDQCPDFDDSLIGTACDDGDDCSINDIYTANCDCEGTILDSDGDGVCDEDDQCPDFDDSLIGTACDDGDDCSINDIYTANCDCEGTIQDSDGDGVCDADDLCPDFDDSLIGTACDDGDDCSINDVYTANCDCEGTIQDSDGDGVCDADDQCPGFDDSLIGTACDDGDDCSINDVYTTDCDCEGTIQDSDGDGVCDADDLCPGFDDSLIGTACDDGDDCSINDVYTTNCDCEGTIQDSDGDGVCDADDQCPGFDDSLIGTACDDGDDCSINDVYTTNCDCEGTIQDSDGDGVCDEDDQCPGFDDNLIGTACDDGDDCTVNDVYTTACLCAGEETNYSVDFATSPTFCELDNGIAEATVTPPGDYSFIWNGNPGNDFEFDLPAGNNNLELIDNATGCGIIFNFTIEQGTSPDLFEVIGIIPDPGNGQGAIIIELNNPYDGPYQVCYNGINSGFNDCIGPINNGQYQLTGPADDYQIQVQVLNGAPVPCIQIGNDVIPLEPPLAETNNNKLYFTFSTFSFNPVGIGNRENNINRFYPLGNQVKFGLFYRINPKFDVGINFWQLNQFARTNIYPPYIFEPALRINIDK